MDFDFSAEQKELRDQVRRFLADRCGRAAVRAILDGPEPFDRALWSGMGELGYLGATIPEAYGGLGLGYLEACVIAEELGRVVAPVPFLSSIALVAECLNLAGSDHQKSRWLPGMADGSIIGALAVAEAAGRHPLRTIKSVAAPDGDAWRLSGIKAAVMDGDIADLAVVAAREASVTGPVSLFLVDLSGPGVRRNPVKTIDPTRSHAQIELEGAAVHRLGELGQAEFVLERVYDRAAVLVGFEQLGGAERAMEMGRNYALERFAFGRPIGSMQAIKHLLAEMFVQTALTRANCYYAAWALSALAAELPVAAAGARVCATLAYQFCSRHNIQVHGGMGFTWEFDCHLYYRRANLLALALGPLSIWEDKLIQRMRDKHQAATQLAA